MQDGKYMTGEFLGSYTITSIDKRGNTSTNCMTSKNVMKKDEKEFLSTEFITKDLKEKF